MEDFTKGGLVEGTKGEGASPLVCNDYFIPRTLYSTLLEQERHGLRKTMEDMADKGLKALVVKDIGWMQSCNSGSEGSTSWNTDLSPEQILADIDDFAESLMDNSLRAPTSGPALELVHEFGTTSFLKDGRVVATMETETFRDLSRRFLSENSEH